MQTLSVIYAQRPLLHGAGGAAVGRLELGGGHRRRELGVPPVVAATPRRNPASSLLPAYSSVRLRKLANLVVVLYL